MSSYQTKKDYDQSVTSHAGDFHNTKTDANIAAEGNKGHCILLIQFNADDNTRTYLDYDNVKHCVDGLCNMYEQKLKVQNPQ